MLIYPLRLRVPARLLGPILELVEGEGIAIEVGKPEEEAPAAPRRKRQVRHTNGGFSRRTVLTVAARGGTAADVTVEFERAGFLPDSAYNAVRKAASLGLVATNSDKTLSLTAAGTEFLARFGPPQLKIVENDS